MSSSSSSKSPKKPSLKTKTKRFSSSHALKRSEMISKVRRSFSHHISALWHRTFRMPQSYEAGLARATWRTWVKRRLSRMTDYRDCITIDLRNYGRLVVDGWMMVRWWMIVGMVDDGEKRWTPSLSLFLYLCGLDYTDKDHRSSPKCIRIMGPLHQSTGLSRSSSYPGHRY